MNEPDPPGNPALDREDAREELYGAREYPPGLQTPQRPSQPDSGLRWPRCATCGGRIQLEWSRWSEVGFWRHLDLVDLDPVHEATRTAWHPVTTHVTAYRWPGDECDGPSCYGADHNWPCPAQNLD